MIERSTQDYKIYYDILEPKGSGGFGTVFKGKEKKTNELRAIKLIDLNKIRNNLSLTLDENEDIEENLKLCIDGIKKEFEIMKICSNKNNNSIKCYEYFINKNNFIIIMELCDKNLLELLMEKKLIYKRYFNSEEIFSNNEAIK